MDKTLVQVTSVICVIAGKKRSTEDDSCRHITNGFSVLWEADCAEFLDISS